MVQIRKATGKELTNFWADRWGARAGEAPMVSRVRTAKDFDSQGSYGYAITDEANWSTNNILIHSIRCINMDEGSNLDSSVTHHHYAKMRIFDNSISTTDMSGASKKLEFMVNPQKRKNNTVTLVFPIPILLVNGGRVARSTAADGPIINICYTVLESMGEIDPHKDIYLQSYFTEGNINDEVVADSDVEVYGVYLNTPATAESSGFSTSTEPAGVRIKNGAGSTRADVYISEMWSASYGDEELDSSDPPMWFPFPVYLKDGFYQAAVGSTTAKVLLFSTSFYRKVNALGLDHGWT